MYKNITFAVFCFHINQKRLGNCRHPDVYCTMLSLRLSIAARSEVIYCPYCISSYCFISKSDKITIYSYQGYYFILFDVFLYLLIPTNCNKNSPFLDWLVIYHCLFSVITGVNNSHVGPFEYRDNCLNTHYKVQFNDFLFLFIHHSSSSGNMSVV